MPLFEYTGSALDGSKSHGRVKVSNQQELRRLLLDRGIIVSGARPVREHSGEVASRFPAATSPREKP